MLAGVEVPIVIVGFGNAEDIVKCLTAIGNAARLPKDRGLHLRKWGRGCV